MDESEDTMSSEDRKMTESPFLIQSKPKKRSLVERELETNMTARVTTPVTNGDNGATSRFGRTRRLITSTDNIDTEKDSKVMGSPVSQKTPVKIQSPVYKMHASNSPIKKEPLESPQKVIATNSTFDNQIENIYHENISLSRFGSAEKKSSPGKKFPKVYVRKDLIQSREKDDYVMMIKNMFSPVKSAQKSNTHLNNILERSAEKYSLNTSMDNSKSHNSFLSNSSVVKTLDFDSNKKKKKENREGKAVLSKSDLFDLEAKCEYQVGDLAWARMGTFPFWPCIVTREPATGMFVKKKLFGRVEHDIIHVTFFGDNGRRGWIVDTMLRKFLGQLEFEATRDTFSPSAKKKDPRLYAAFFVSEKKMGQWNISVEEAETLLREPKRLRIDILYDMIAKSRSLKNTSKQQKSGKVARTVSDVASDVSLSESLYDTLFSEDDGKTEDTEKSRSKTRMSLDVSEVVTACLDNMAAKTGITKIQRQSHMDRWLQKAKSKTPEKLQANVPPPKEKDGKGASSKKKKKISPIRVPIQKPYSFRKSSYEPQILKSHDNEHDYSTKISNDPPQTGDDDRVTAGFGIGLIVKVESLHGKTESGQSTDTKCGPTIDSDTLKKEPDTDITPQENTNNTIEIGPILTEEHIDEIQVNMCSVEENDELLLGHTDKPIEMSQIVGELSTDKKKHIKSTQITNKRRFNTEKKSANTKKSNEDSMNAEKQVEIITQAQEITRMPHEHTINIEESAEIAKIPDKHRKCKEKSIDVTLNVENIKVSNVHTMNKKTTNEVTQGAVSRKMNTEKANKNIVLSDSRNSAQFVKYLELRQNSIMDEHPELSQDQIEDYLYKTWQYEESSKSDFKSNDDVKQSCLKKGLTVNLRHKSVKYATNTYKKYKKCLSLNSNARKKRSEKRIDTISMNSLISGSSIRRLRTRLLDSQAINSDINESTSSVTSESSTDKAIEKTQVVTEHSIKKHHETAQKPDKHGMDTSILSENDMDKEKIETTHIVGSTPARRSLRTRLLNSPTVFIDTNERMCSVSKESSAIKDTESSIITEHTCNEKAQTPTGYGIETSVLSENNMDKEKKESTHIAGSASTQKSLRTKLLNSPAMSMDTNENLSSVSKENSTVKTSECTQIVTEYSYTEKVHEKPQTPIEHKMETPKPSENNVDKEKIETTHFAGGLSTRRSLRTRLLNSPAISMDTNDRVNSVNKETSIVKATESPQIGTEHSYTAKHEKAQKPAEYAIDTPILTENNKEEKKEINQQISDGGSARRNLRNRLLNTPVISVDTDKKISIISKESSTVKATESTEIVTEHSYIEKHNGKAQTPLDHGIDTPKLSKNKIDKEQTESAQIVGTSTRRGLRTRLLNSSSLSIDTNERISNVNKESITVKASESTEVVTERSYTGKHHEKTPTPADHGIDTPKISENNMVKEETESVEIVGGTTARRSLRTRLSNSSAMPIDTNERISSVSKDSGSVKTECNEIVTHSSYSENHEKACKSDEHGIDTPKPSENSEEKEKTETPQVVSWNSARRSLRTRLSNAVAMSLEKNEIINSVSKDSGSVKTIESTQIASEHHEKVQQLDEQEMDTPIISECNANINNYSENQAEKTHKPGHAIDTSMYSENNTDKVGTAPIVGSTSARRSLRTRQPITLAVSLQSNEIMSCVNKESSSEKAIVSTQIVTALHETAQQPDENGMDIPITFECNVDTEKIEQIEKEHKTSTEKRIESTQAIKSIDREKQVDIMHIVEERSIEEKMQAGSALVTDDHSTNTEKQIDIIKETNEPSIDTEKLVDVTQTADKHDINPKTRSEIIQKADGHHTDTKTPIEITKLTYISKQTGVTQKDGCAVDTEKPVKITQLTQQSCVGSHKPIDSVTQTVNPRSTDIKHKTEITQAGGCSSDVEKSGKITHIAEEPSIHSKNQSEITLVMDKQPVTSQAVSDELKEYEHLDFLFSGVNEQLCATNDISRPMITNSDNVSNDYIPPKDFEKAESVVVETDNNNMNLKPDKTNLRNRLKNRTDKSVNSFSDTETVPCKMKGTTIDDLDKCKYKNLYDSCTELKVCIEKLPRRILTHKYINIEDLDEEILLGNSRKKSVEYIDDKSTTVANEKISQELIRNTHYKAPSIAHTAETDCITTQNVVKIIDEKNCESKMSESNENIDFVKTTKDKDAVSENLANMKVTKCDYADNVMSSEMLAEKVCFDKPELQTYKNIDTHINKEKKEDTLVNINNKKDMQEKADTQPVAIVKSETVPECLQIKPTAIANGFEYIYDDDEDEFESPAFSPIFKEPIDTTPDNNEDGNEANNDLDAVKHKNDVAGNGVVKDASSELPLNTELLISAEIKKQENVTNHNINDLIKIENDAFDDEDKLMTSVSRLPDPIKMNGYHLDEYGLDFSDNDFNVETSSINSEDSEPLSITKNKLLNKNRKTPKQSLQDVEFRKYLVLRQDALMEEHPELNQNEIEDYLYKIWQNEENSKSDIRRNDDIEQAGLVKGLNDNLRQKSIRNSYRENKKRNKKRDDDALSINLNINKKRSKKGDEDTLSITSDTSDTSTRRRLRTRLSCSPAISMDENEFIVSKESSPERKLEIDSDDSIKITKRRVRNQILDDSLDSDESFVFKESKDPKSKEESRVKETVKTEDTRLRKSLEKKENKSPKNLNDSKIKKYFAVVNSTADNKNYHIGEQNKIDVNTNIKEEYDPDTVSVTSINSEDSEVSISKRIHCKNAEKQAAKTMDDPEFLKYVEMRQDILIDENPQLTNEEITAYLFKTWLHEESVKSELKKSDDIEQANLVKGLTSEVQPKKVKKKIKVEKSPIEEEVAPKDKPRRKISQPYYNEDIMSDIEDEIELFEIFKTKKKQNSIKSEESKSNVDVKTEVDEILIQDEIDEVELYFSQLPLPKPNLFKGLVREKVCEICEKTGNLVKCKGCSSMFHVNCEKKYAEEEEGVVSSTRGRKKKKKPGRKPKNYEDSESHSDEKSQDVSEEHNASIDEIETEPRVVDEAIIEAALTAKMKELLPTIDLTYDSYSSDDGLDWNSAPPGQCEIVDIKLKPKIAMDCSDFKCKNCQKYPTPVCFVCKEAMSKTGVDHRQKCQTNHCNKYYHLECLDHWPQTQFNSGEPSKSNRKINEHFEAVMCPRHVCHTCVSDDPRGCKTRFSGDKLARCVKCPATYHSFTKCLPAGTQILTGSLIVCPRHYENRPGKVPCHVNTGWCFICALGGSLICCEYCPTSFHAECLNIEPPEGGYMCEDCETGRLPLYGEMVWVKLGHYRWWPGIILHPSEIPENILAVKHSPGEFVVRFFGQYDHYWVNRGRVFPFQEGDSGRISTQKSKIDAAFITAMEHAHRAFEILKSAQPNDEESIDIASSLLPPHYVKLKVNKPCGSLVGRRPDIEESSLTQCECDPQVEDPCGPYSHCLNRMLLTECGPICRAGDRCSNRAFEKRLYPKMVPYRTPQRGWGLKTLVDIKAGQFVIEYVGELLDEEEFKRRMNRMHEIRDENFYFLTLDKERMIDAGPKGNLARFMNHCCEPNCETQKWTVLGDVRVGLFAINDIPANSELTFNYNLECTGIEKKRCLCGARLCSGYIGAKPKQEETQPKKKRAYKKRAKPVEESPSTSKNKPKRPVGRPAKPRELTEIEKDLLIIKNATNGISSDSEASSRLSSIDNPNPKALKRKRVCFSTEESGSSPNTKKTRIEDSPSTETTIEDSSPSLKKAKSEEIINSPSTKRVKIEEKSEVGD